MITLMGLIDNNHKFGLITRHKINNVHALSSLVSKQTTLINSMN